MPACKCDRTDRRGRLALFAVLVFLCLAQASKAMQPNSDSAPLLPAELKGYWWIDGSEGLDISGLAFCDGELLAVADKSSESIYVLRPKPATHNVSLAPKATFTRPDLPRDQPVSLKARALHIASRPLSMDFEGITCAGGQVYLLSERHNRIARLDPVTHRAQWLGPRWSEAARARGYLQQFNGESEGLVKAGEDFWVALERDPRGLLRLKPGDEEGSEFHPVPPVAALDFRGRSEDLTALATFDGALFTLERNAFAVCRRSLDTLEAVWCLDYRPFEEGPETVYLETRYGKGEGLAVNESGIYVVLDNNGVGRAAAPDDNRGLLLHLGFPDLGKTAAESRSERKVQ